MADDKWLDVTAESLADFERLAQRCRLLSETAVTIARDGELYTAAMVRSFHPEPETLHLSIVFDGVLWGLCMSLEEFVAASLKGAGAAPKVAEE